MLTILMGRARTGKSAWVLEKIRQLGDGSRQILLVPEHASHAAEMDLCAACGDTASRHAEVLSFRRLATRVLSRTGGLADVTLDAGGKLLTLQKALCETAPALKIYRRPSRKAAFLQELLALFDELRSYEVSPEDLAEKAGEIAGVTGEKLADLSLLYGAYEARLHRPGMDARDRMSKLCDHLEESGYIDGKDLFLDGFTYFNSQELRALAVCLRRARSVTVTLLGEPEGGRNELFEAAYRTRDALLRLAEENGCRCAVTCLPAAPAEDPLMHLEACFFGENRPWAGEAEGIRLRRCADAYAEVEQTAAEIRRLAASGQYRYRDITVSARNMADYEPIIETVFRRYEIPVYMSRRSDILQTPAIALITGALAAVTGGYEYEDVFRCLKTGLAGLSPEECDRLENYALTWDIHGAMWRKAEDWAANPGGYGAPWDDRQREELAEINRLRRRVQSAFSLLHDGLNTADTADKKVDALYTYLEEIGLQSSLEEQMRRLAEAGQLQRAEETAQLWDILCQVLDQFVELLRGEVMDSDEFVRLLRQVLTQYSVGTIPVALDQVNVSEITRNDRHTVRVLFLLGANDHVLPSPGTGGGILNDDDRDELVSRGLRLAPRGMEQLSIELQNLYAALAQPTERLWISYPAADAAGAELRPAFVIDRVRGLFPTVEVEFSTDRAERLTAPVPALEAAGDFPGGALWAYFARQEDRAGALAAMDRAGKMGRGRLSPQAVRRLYGRRFHMSASRVERLNSCHFAYFMEYGLRAKERRRADFDAPQIGTFLHYLLENVTRDVMARGGFAQVEDQELEALTERYIARFEEQEYENFRERSPRFRYLFRRLRTTALAVVRETAEELRHSDFVPLAFELSFGDRGELPAVVVSEPGGELRINGKVDRVDGWLKDGRLYLRVVDYKTGRKSFDLAEVRAGLDLQMLLYLFALEKEGAGHFGHEIEPAGVLYFPARNEVLAAERNVTPEKLAAMRAKTLRRSGLLLEEPEVRRAMEHEALTAPQYLPMRVGKDGSISGGVASAARLGRLGRYVEELLHKIAREVRDGNIDADPCCRSEEDVQCRFCPWVSACHFQDGRGGDRLHHITPLQPEEFWRQIGGEGGEVHG